MPITNQHCENSNFQIEYFLKSHTLDGYWSFLYGQLISVGYKIKYAEVKKLEKEIKVKKANKILKSIFSSSIKKLESKKELIEVSAEDYTFDMNLQGAIKERDFIKAKMVEIEKDCKYKDLPLLQRNEASKREEWLYELKFRIENHMFAYGTIKPDLMDTLRHHPEFVSVLLPYIKELGNRINLERSPFVAIENDINLIEEKHYVNV